MPNLRFLAGRIRALWRREELFDDMAAEMRSHIELRVADNLRNGMTPAQAREDAQRRFGHVDRICEDAYKVRGPGFIEVLLQDIRFGFRMLRRSPGFSLVALFCLSAAIGSNAAVMSWIEGILLRPYPAVAHQDRMRAIVGTHVGVAGAPGESEGLSWPDFQDLRKNCSLIEAFIVDRITGTTLSIGDHAERATGAIVSSNYFQALGIRPALGRTFEPAEDVGRNSHPVTVISYDLWKKRYGGRQDIIGATQLLNGEPHTIVGVAPEGFDGTFVGWATQFWVPVSMQERFDQPGYKLEDRGARWIEGYVMLKPGVTSQQAEQELSAVARRLEQAYPATNRDRGIKLFPLWQTPFNGAGTLLPTLGICLVVVVFVLLIACANVSNLMLVRSLARRHEMTVRMAIGASRTRLVRQLLTEGTILAVLASAIGLLLANWLRNSLVLLLPSTGNLKMHLPGEIDWRVMSVSIGICLFATILFAVVPAIQASKIDIAGTLKIESGSMAGSKRSNNTRSAFVLVQVACSFVLLVGCGLVLASLRNMQKNSPGFLQDDVLTSFIDFTAAGYKLEEARTFQDELLDRLRALPQVKSAAFSRIRAFEYRSYSSAPVAGDTSHLTPDQVPTVSYNEVSPDYFRTMGIALLSGREFSRSDDQNAPRVAIVNDTLAAQLWPGQDAVGRRLSVADKSVQVVGVAKTTRYRFLTESAQPFFYIPLRQGPMGEILQVRTALPAQSLAAALVREIHSIDPGLAPTGVITMRQQVERTTGPQQLALKMTGLFACIALLLAVVGLYGVMSYAVAQSSRELGLRAALGAAPADLLRMVLSRGIRLAAFGIAVGAAVALGCSRLLGYLLYKVSPRDPLIFAMAVAIMTVAALAASLGPAWRASRADALTTLRAS